MIATVLKVGGIEFGIEFERAAKTGELGMEKIVEKPRMTKNKGGKNKQWN